MDELKQVIKEAKEKKKMAAYGEFGLGNNALYYFYILN